MEELTARPGDLAALLLFLMIWLAYEPILKGLAHGRRMINADMVRVRRAWMTQMVDRQGSRLLDSQLVGHALNSASFFASSNLILIAGAAGVLFGGENAYQRLETAPLLAHAPKALFGLKMTLVAMTLARGLLAFIWAIRQLNYCVAAIGAAPESAPAETRTAYGQAVARLLNPALSSFNAGVRGYYFALASTAWLAGPAAFAAATLGAMALLAWRQAASPAAGALRDVRAILDETGLRDGILQPAETPTSTKPDTPAP